MDIDFDGMPYQTEEMDIDFDADGIPYQADVDYDNTGAFALMMSTLISNPQMKMKSLRSRAILGT
ncbi:hypothetical protein E4U13_004888, partial [Claviceps humidiphila]